MSTSFADICFFPQVKAGILRTAPQVANSSSIKNPLSARTQSPNVTLSKKPEFSVISLSEALPPQPADKKLTVPDGVMPTKCLMLQSIFKIFKMMVDFYAMLPFLAIQ